jgi:iron-sulfur cluster assembly accessory protein
MQEEIIFSEFDEDEEYPISFTANAVVEVKKALQLENFKNGELLRVGIRGGGCAGFEYVLDFTLPKKYDYKMTFDGLEVLIDPVSSVHLEGTEIDYVTKLMESGFKFNNPNAKKTCGCGSSFG